MNKRILKVLVVVMLVLSLFTLVACGNNNNTPNNTPDGSVSGGSDTNTENNNDNTDVTEPTPPKKGSINKYFSGIKIAYPKDDSAFNKYLGDEIDSVATEVMYRLYMMYGTDTYANDKYQSQSLVVNSNTITKDKALVDTALAEVPATNLDDIKTYQNVIKNGRENETINRRAILMFNEAINGMYMEYDADDFALKIGKNVSESYYNPTQYRWAMGENADTFENWLTKYKEDVKLGIAKILLGDENSTLAYWDIIKKLDSLGFDDTFASKLTEYINNNIIGSNRVLKDTAVYAMYTAEDKVTPKNWTATDEIDKHFYKGYGVVVPAIVEQIVNNTTRYPYFSRNKVEIKDNEIRTPHITNHCDIVLMAKEGTVATKLEVCFYGKSSNEYDVNIEVVNGTNIKTTTMHIVPDNRAYTTTIDLNAFASGIKFGNYVGSKVGVGCSNPYTNNTEVRGANYDTDNYIKISIKGKLDAQFFIDFKGYYDKVA